MDKKSIKVYIVDDEPSVVKWLVNNVDWGNYNCEVVGYTTNSLEALQFLNTYPIGLLVTDISMPEVSGLDLCRKARELQPDVFIIVISAYDRFAYVKEALQYKIIDYCMKPIDETELGNCLKTVGMMENNRILNQKYSSNLLLRNSVFQRLLREEIYDAVFEEQCELAEINLSCTHCRVVLIDNSNLDKSERTKLFNTISERKLPNLYCFLDLYMNLVLLYMSDKTEDSYVAEEMKVILQKILNKCFISVGRPLRNYRKISSSYQECSCFLCAKNIFRDSIVYIENYPYEKYLPHMKSKKVQRITNYLEVGHWEQALQIMEDILEEHKDIEQQKRELLCLFVFLVNREGIISLNEMLSKILIQYWDGKNMNKYKMMDMLRRFYRVSKNDSMSKSNTVHPYVRKALQEVCDHYGNTSVSLQRIAKDCGISSYYLGNLFKEQVGEYFNDYLMRKRLNAAELLLCERDMLISKIAEQVGFSSQSYFNKKFFQKYGMSPSEFRHKCYRMDRENE